MALPKKKRAHARTATDDSSAQIVDLDRPEVPAVLDPLDPFGLLPTGSQNQDLEVRVPKRWEYSAPDPNWSDIVKLYWGLSTRALDVVDEVRVIGPVTDAMFPLSLKVPRNRLQADGRYDIQYVVTSFNTFVVPSFVTVVTLDTQPPSYDKQPEALLFPADLVNNIITEDYLLTHQDTVVLRLPLPLYTGAADGDQLLLWWSDRDPPLGDPVHIETISDADIIAQDIRVDLTGAVIRAPNKNGTFYAFYKLRDRAGNETLVFSKPAEATVSLIPLPGVLPPPRVPAQESDALVNRADARAQVTVLIEPPLNNVLPTDDIVVTWDGTELPPQPAILPLTVPVPWTVLVAQGLGPIRAMPVAYEVNRPPFPPFPSQPLPINVDFTVAGQDHPGAPALLNPLLELLDIIGGSGTPNVLLPADRAFPVVPYLTLYQTPNAGEVLELYWGSVAGPVARYDVQPGDSEGDRVAFTTVPWSVIDMDPNNAQLPVYYTTSNGVNEQQSENQYVRVQVVTINDLPEPVFEDEDAFGYIQCDKKPWEGIRVRVNFDSGHFGLGDEIMVFWQGYRNFNSTDPIPETYGEFPETVGADHVRDGYIDVWIQPYEPYIKPVTRGSWGTYYTLTKTSGQFGTSPAPENLKIIETVSPDMCPPI
ncbi:hypothetical protein HX870_18435 [Pseudomonas gingeri]|uniref:hypothetical protein n=1 Tax=Pseudomonas gingeri TaxID=117681 RepID=UPI0015A4CEBB|nr:hypothetical protein [Pseudomonas gingeri]NWD69577.1 hypothetical protein [Pseudomonas gingeri]NWD78207.1 hypothetical protein [Pseudomonas gingeri]